METGTKTGRKPGTPKTGGRQAGTPNKLTSDVRAAIALLAERNVARLQQWLDEVAKKDPAKAADLFIRMIEYHVPKLARQDITTGGQPLPRHVEITILPVAPKG